MHAWSDRELVRYFARAEAGRLAHAAAPQPLPDASPHQTPPRFNRSHPHSPASQPASLTSSNPRPNPVSPDPTPLQQHPTPPHQRFARSGEASNTTPLEMCLKNLLSGKRDGESGSELTEAKQSPLRLPRVIFDDRELVNWEARLEEASTVSLTFDEAPPAVMASASVAGTSSASVSTQLPNAAPRNSPHSCLRKPPAAGLSGWQPGSGCNWLGDSPSSLPPRSPSDLSSTALESRPVQKFMVQLSQGVTPGRAVLLNIPSGGHARLKVPISGVGQFVRFNVPEEPPLLYATGVEGQYSLSVPEGVQGGPAALPRPPPRG